MTVAAPPSQNGPAIDSPHGEKPSSASSFIAGEATVEEPPVVRQFTLQSQGGAKEVTVRQVAPLVLVLTGATFLNASTPSLQSGVYRPMASIISQSLS